jgi:hypothetical protein
MGKKIDTIRLFLLLWVFFATFPDTVMATQTHGDPEGLFVHQFAHGFFVISLAIFIYWLRFRNLIVETGWRYIQYASFLLILWNVDATIAHMFDEQIQMIEVERMGHWYMKITSADNTNFTIILYYLVKLDHLLCVPALIFLYAGLKQFLKEPLPSVPESGSREELRS